MSDGMSARPEDPDLPAQGAGGEHLDAEALADLDAGLLDREETESARNHLAACSACAADLAVLADLPRRLAAVADAGPVPPDVAQRLDEALAAEPAVQAAGAATVTPLTTRDERRPASRVRGMRLLQAAAVIVLALGGSAVVISAQQGGADNATSSAAGAAPESADRAADTGTFPVTASERVWTADTVVAAVPELLAGTVRPAVPAAGATAEEQTSGGGDEGTGSGNPSVPADARTQRGEVLADNGARRLAGGPALAECVTALNDGPVTPLAVDLATWEGEPAAVVVLPTLDDAGSVDVWVVGPDCALADAKVLFFARRARP